MDGGFNLARHALGAARTTPGRVALIVADRPDGHVAERWSYGELESAVRATAAGLRDRGLASGDRVLLRLGNTSDFPVLFLGAVAAGLVAVPTSSMLTTAEVDRIVADAEPALVLADGEAALPSGGPPVVGRADFRRWRTGPAADWASTGAEDPAFLVYTSGTAGRPKGVLHAQRSLLGRRPMYRGWYGIGPEDRFLHAGAMNWTYTLGAGLMDPWVNGATAIVYTGDRSDPALWLDLVEGTGATLFAAVPAVFRRLLKHAAVGPDRMPSLRHALTAGEALPASLHAAFVAATGRPLYEALGMSEISTYVSSGPQVPVRPGSPGRAQDGRRIAVLPLDGGDVPLAPGEAGLLAVHRSDPGLTLGYWRQPETTARSYRGEWFVTGDVARLDADGYVWFEGRADDQMNAMGYRVAPEEVEAVIARHPDVAEVAVAETRAGEVALVTAFVVPRAGVRIDEAALDAFARAELAAYKAPRRFVVVDDLPRTPTGKVARRVLRDA